MSALKKRSNSLAGLTLDAVLGGEIVIPPPPPSSSPPSPPPLPQKSLVISHPTTTATTQTLFDIIRDEYNKEGQKDRTTWQIFREKLRLKRTGSAWTSSLYIPASDILIPIPKHFRPTNSSVPMSDPPPGGRGAFTRGPSMRVGSDKNHHEDSADVSIPGDGPPSRSFKPQFSRHDSVREHGDGDDDRIRRHPVVKFVDERQMSAREAVAAQEASEAEAAAAGSDDDDEEEEEEEDSEEDVGDEKADAQQPKQTMSLMDLLEETDRQMGLTGASYAMDEEEEEYEEEEEEEEEEEDGGGGGGGEANCCVCQVNFRGATFTPCGHTFCKLCSKELMAQKGHCPVCSSFVLEFLEIF